MQLKVKPIINSLFHATVTQEGFEATAIGNTKNEAIKKALEGLKREIEAEETRNDGIEIEDEDLDSAATENELDDDEQDLYTGEFLKDEVWSGLEEEVQKLAMEVAKIALRVTLRYMMRNSTGGSVGGLFF